jgi:hypothetical protein
MDDARQLAQGTDASYLSSREVCLPVGVKLPLTELFTGYGNDYHGRQTFGQDTTAT